jgi:hypothetical protein
MFFHIHLEIHDQGSSPDAHDVLAKNKISNPTEHQWALKRSEQLWQAKPGTEEGKELNVLAEIVCKYEDTFFS